MRREIDAGIFVEIFIPIVVTSCILLIPLTRYENGISFSFLSAPPRG